MSPRLRLVQQSGRQELTERLVYSAASSPLSLLTLDHLRRTSPTPQATTVGRARQDFAMILSAAPKADYSSFLDGSQVRCNGFEKFDRGSSPIPLTFEVYLTISSVSLPPRSSQSATSADDKASPVPTSPRATSAGIDPKHPSRPRRARRRRQRPMLPTLCRLRRRTTRFERC